jgi:hypothetical protein
VVSLFVISIITQQASLECSFDATLFPCMYLNRCSP